MGSQVLSIILDIAVLIVLGITIFYCMKLSKSMSNFRRHRQEMNKLIDNLSKNIDEALRAIDGLKITGDRSGKDLQKIINESRKTADELRAINESSNSMANRLESLAERNRLIAQGFEDPGDYEAPASPAPPQRSASREKPAFFIHDRDYNDTRPVGSEDDDVPEHIQSQAEKELFHALRKSKKPSSRGAF